MAEINVNADEIVTPDPKDVVAATTREEVAATLASLVAALEFVSKMTKNTMDDTLATALKSVAGEEWFIDLVVAAIGLIDSGDKDKVVALAQSFVASAAA